ncbi:hypothetical protein N0V88_001462 [Collariella sp. IMI 366227]|nr:hypothetical protein N0V88_001462 [Collariella sp. IMI 366227]
MSATTVTANIDTLTTKFQSLIEPAKQLSNTNVLLLIIGQGPWPVLILGFTDIVTTSTSYITMSSSPRTAYIYTGADATAIGNAFRTFVNIY